MGDVGVEDEFKGFYEIGKGLACQWLLTGIPQGDL